MDKKNSNASFSIIRMQRNGQLVHQSKGQAMPWMNLVQAFFNAIRLKFLKLSVPMKVLTMVLISYLLMGPSFDFKLNIAQESSMVSAENYDAPSTTEDFAPHAEESSPAPVKTKPKAKPVAKAPAKQKSVAQKSPSQPGNPMELGKGPKLSPDAYIKKYAGLAQQEMRRSGVPASITLAQGILESSSGNSKLARELNNHFGIKCFSKQCGHGHCVNYSDDHHKDFFLNFASPEACFRAHSAFVNKPRYRGKVRNKRSYEQWAWALQRGGYATGSQYANKLISLIKRYKLYKYD